MTHIRTSAARAVLLLPVCLIALSTLMPSPATADIYKWLDDGGNINYTQQPPPPGYTSEIIKETRSREATPAPARSKPQERPEAEQKDPKKAAAQAKLEKENAKIRQLNCDAASKNLAILERDGPHDYITANGERIRPTDKERQRLIDEARQQVEEFCTQ